MKSLQNLEALGNIMEMHLCSFLKMHFPILVLWPPCAKENISLIPGTDGTESKEEAGEIAEAAAQGWLDGFAPRCSPTHRHEFCSFHMRFWALFTFDFFSMCFPLAFQTHPCFFQCFHWLLTCFLIYLRAFLIALGFMGFCGFLQSGCQHIFSRFLHVILYLVGLRFVFTFGHHGISLQFLAFSDYRIHSDAMWKHLIKAARMPVQYCYVRTAWIVTASSRS